MKIRNTLTLPTTLVAACLFAWAGNPPAASAAGESEDEAFSVLVFSHTAGFRHQSIPHGIEAIKQLGDEHGFGVEATEDSDAFNPENLERFAAVVFLSTTGTVFEDEHREAFKEYIRAGNGFAGIHAATDTEYDWAWYGELVGAYFSSHPRNQDAVIHVENTDHPSTRHLADRWERYDEWYNFDRNPREDVNVLLALDPDSFEGGEMGDDHPIAWYHEFDGGRSWYTGGGHTEESFSEPEFLEHLLGGILWAAGAKE